MVAVRHGRVTLRVSTHPPTHPLTRTAACLPTRPGACCAADPQCTVMQLFGRNDTEVLAQVRWHRTSPVQQPCLLAAARQPAAARPLRRVLPCAALPLQRGRRRRCQRPARPACCAPILSCRRSPPCSPRSTCRSPQPTSTRAAARARCGTCSASPAPTARRCARCFAGSQPQAGAVTSAGPLTCRPSGCSAQRNAGMMQGERRTSARAAAGPRPRSQRRRGCRPPSLPAPLAAAAPCPRAAAAPGRLGQASVAAAGGAGQQHAQQQALHLRSCGGGGRQQHAGVRAACLLGLTRGCGGRCCHLLPLGSAAGQPPADQQRSTCASMPAPHQSRPPLSLAS